MPLKAFLFLSLSAVLCSGCVKREKPSALTLADGILSVGVEVGYPPMEYYDTDGQTLAGFDIELAKTLAGRLGLTAQFIDTAWEGIMAGLDSGKYDIAVNITILPERQKRYNFTRPYIDSSITIAALKTSHFNIEKPQDIAGFSVAYQSDTTAQYFSEKLISGGVLFKPFSYDKILNCFDDLRLGRVDLVAADNITAWDYALKKDSPFEVVWQGPSDECIGICLKKGNDALTSALDDALDAMFEDGTLLKLSLEIFNRDLVSPLR